MLRPLCSLRVWSADQHLNYQELVRNAGSHLETKLAASEYAF